MTEKEQETRGWGGEMAVWKSWGQKNDTIEEGKPVQRKGKERESGMKSGESFYVGCIRS